jgi:DNA-binding NarL/FixJ family response regulator
LRDIRILVVDDFAGWRSKVRELLGHSADIVGEACDGSEAVEKAAELQPDIVILDIGLPFMNGLEAARLIKQRSRTTAIVFLSGNTDPYIQEEALRVGHAYVLKSNASTDLLAAIKTAQAAAASDSESGSS